MRFSIITVCLNSEKTIEKTIQSVIEQEYSDCEYIIIDGGSKDRTLDIIEKYKKDIAIIISEPDNGIYDAMNKGIALASGEVIGIINSDDWYELYVFEKVKKCFQISDAEIIYGCLRTISDENISKILVPENIEKLRYEMAIPHPTIFVKKDIYRKYGMFCLEYMIAADYELILRFYTKGVKFYGSNDIFANFRTGGISVQKGKKCIEETLTISRKYLSSVSGSERKNLKNIILQKWKGLYFLDLLNEYSYMLIKILIHKFGLHFQDKVVIFGAGNWGLKTSQALRQNGIHTLFFVDNDKEKWGKIESGVHVFSPEILYSFKGVLLLTVEKFSMEILSQIERIGNREILYITWEEIVRQYRNWKRGLRK
ncbi:MAG: glycosyltransferase [Lachnospiraceae bacterium]|nr:glycosyltransferase [Lachnospiraceae bacterium]